MITSLLLQLLSSLGFCPSGSTISSHVWRLWRELSR